MTARGTPWSMQETDCSIRQGEERMTNKALGLFGLRTETGLEGDYERD